MVGAVALLAIAAACNSAPPTRADYRRQVRAICRATGAAAPRPTTTDAAELVAAGRRSVARQRRALHDIEALRVPAADEGTIGRWLALVRRTLDAADRSLAAQADGDLAAAARANAEGAALAARASEVATPLGVPECASSTG
jgi:hypothetical protein